MLLGQTAFCAQAKELFGGPEETLDEEAGEEDNTGNAAGNNTLPDYVISLQATDEFLCARVMALPERELQV